MENDVTMDIAQYHGQFISITFKSDRNKLSAKGILDASKYPILRIEDEMFIEDDISSCTIGDPKEYPPRRI